jgi:hypothetical protein
MLKHDLISLAEFAGEFVVIASLVNAWRHRTPRRPRPRRCPRHGACPACFGRFANHCRACHATGRVWPPSRKEIH